MGVATVETGPKFAAAMADNNVGTIVVRRFALVLNDSDFEALGVNIPIKILRNVTVRGDAALGYWPFLYLGGSYRMTLGAGVTMQFLDIVVDTPQGDGALRAPHLQILTFSEPGANARLLYGPGAGIMISGCFGPALQLQNVQALPRAAGYPGPQVVQAGLPQPGCVNDTYAPYMKRCWPQISNFVDVTMVGRRPDAASNLQPTNYAWILRNATAVCRALVPAECVAKLGPAACMLMTVRNLSSVLATVLEPPQNTSGIGLTSEGSSGDDGSDSSLAIVLGCVLGGVGLAAIVSGIAYMAHRRRLGAAGLAVGAKGEVDGGAGGPAGGAAGGDGKAGGQEQPHQPQGDDATTEGSDEGAHAEAARLAPNVAAAAPALDLITKHTPRQPGIELDVRVAGPAATEALLLAQHQSRKSCSSPPASTTPLAFPPAAAVDSGRLQKHPRGSQAAGAGAGSCGATANGFVRSVTGELTSQASIQHPTDDSVPRTFSSYLPASGGLGTSGTHDVPPPVTSASIEEPPVLTLLPVVRGVGACGRVVEGIYMGQRVAVKLLDRGLLYNYPSSCTAPSTAGLLSEPHPSSGAHAAAAEPSGAAAERGAVACGAGDSVSAGGIVAAVPLPDGTGLGSAAGEVLTAASTGGRTADAADVSLRLGASLADEEGGVSASAAPPDSVSLRLLHPPQPLAPAEPAAEAAVATGGAAVSPAELMLGTQSQAQSQMHHPSTAKPMSRKDRISHSTTAFPGLTIRHASAADMAAAAPGAAAALLAVVSMPEADGMGSPAALARPVALAALAKQHGGDGATPHAVPQRGGVRFLGVKQGESLWSTHDANSSVPAGFGAHAIFRNHLASPGADGSSSLGLSAIMDGAACSGEQAAKDRAGRGGAEPAERASAVLQAMAQELEVLAKLAHPNIVKLLAANLSPPTPCLVLELMDTSLDKLLYGGVAGGGGGGGLMPLGKVLHVALQIASALSHLHPTILHRDLKPANVLVSQPFSATPVVKLADFGLARLQETVLVTARVDVGTAAYMAPECLNALNCVVTHHADMFSFGVLLYEMLAGARPWEGCSMVQVAYRVTDGQRPPLDSLSFERCPRALRSLITACWDPVPERRPAACEVAKELILIKRKVAGDGGGAVLQQQQHSGTSMDVQMIAGRGQTWEPRPSA
ncbi:hypothetical protein HXX76_003873 [Chlamydomonas incerta]|uniref:Protein kinase domain-containing protein n=1 Tax=Chlamydomonas incerta TaxID=51695 RepID=A0A835TNH4_CHLIN|nr:hypothetical protein HXX76_003873 [Chlamydomonas incerta]|eukprot:KAG2441020.1 hypothetical protein HXX76_003873 [Chlamydomonas incerta]